MMSEKHDAQKNASADAKDTEAGSFELDKKREQS